MGLLGCKDFAGTQPLPAGTVYPSSIQNAEGAAGLAVTAIAKFQQALADYIVDAGLLSDELQAAARGPVTALQNVSAVYLDARMLDQNTDWTRGINGADALYTELQDARNSAFYAIKALEAYAPTTMKNRRGELYALMGYEEIMLADLFCSGVPLSTLDFQGDFTYQAGSTTAQIYTHAVTLFDSARTLAADSVQILSLARIGQGRAYLDLGQYAAAGNIVSGVPLDFQYADSLLTCGGLMSCPTFGVGNDSTLSMSYAQFELPVYGSVADQEGGVGLPFISSGDPRTMVTDLGTPQYGEFPVFFPNKYNAAGISVIPVATGIEAQLIVAEAALQASNGATTIAMLNTLRQDSTLTSGLIPIPETLPDSSLVDTLFAERAAWLFLTGQRQGDLRRLMRNYRRTNVYPSGPYPGLGAYGTFVDVPIPKAELNNPLFHGCSHRD
jgi:hypothetical protein